MIKDTKTIAVIGIVAILLIAGIAVVVINNNKGGDNPGPAPDPKDIANMTWEQIEDAARGTTVNMGFYFDAYCMQWFNDVLKPLAQERYGITIVNKGYTTGAMVVAEYNKLPEGSSGSYDFVWGRSSDLAALLNADGNGKNIIFQSDWQSKMPNVTNYSDTIADATWQNTYDARNGAGSYSREVCSVTPFSGSTTTFVYNKEYNDEGIAFDEVRVYDAINDKSYIVKVGLDGATLDLENISTTTVYDIESVRAQCRGEESAIGWTCYYGLPHNYVELADWVMLYPEQFYLPSATGGANFHVQLILEAMIYELAATDAAGSDWTACTDKDAYVWSADLKGKYTGDAVKDSATYKEYIESKVLTVKNAADYGKVVPYLAAYLADIAPYLNQTYSHAASLQNSYLIGNILDVDDFGPGTIMIALSTVESLSLRTETYPGADLGMYMMETACANRCGLFMPCNSPNPAGAIVIMNLMNDPWLQSTYYNIAGNGYNMDKDKLSTEQWLYFEAYISEWTVTGKPFIAPEIVQTNRTVASIGYAEAILSDYAKDLY